MSKPVVVLDPGHGGVDPGAVAHGLREKDLNLELALKTAEMLDGVKVLLTRERDIFVSLADRVALSRRAAPNLFLSLHANAGGGRGFESFIASSAGARDPAVTMQRAVHNAVMIALNRWEIVDRGEKRANFFVLRHNPHPAVLIESLFIDNAREAQIWREPLFVETLAAGVARGIREALGLPPDRETAEKAPGGPVTGTTGEYARLPNSTLFSVQVGAFALIENARQRLAEAQKAGFNDAFIYRKQF
ncbi:MAG TPA: N-acetylmuramoyl-L-alanine amidase [Dehalococcoidales bacterium]|nr:N-acetylmuramoyl-L-alanine amidase [Dehalococcoidales bacterium]